MTPRSLQGHQGHNKGKIDTIEKINIPKDSRGAFFYPKYHFGDFRYCWGNPITFWDSGTLLFNEILDNVYSKFRAGSTISIYFTVGLAIPITGRTNNLCLKIEKEYGHGTSIADANDNFRQLRKLFEFFRLQRSTKECIDWALKNIDDFGYWDNNTFMTHWYKRNYDIFEWTARKYTNREITFIGNKLNHNNYCKDMTQYYYYSCDAYELDTSVDKKDTRYHSLTIR